MPALLSAYTADSPRAAGDAIEKAVSEKFRDFIGDWCREYSADFARRSMADLAFSDREDFYCIVDIKTHRTDTVFNMPALTSVERLTRFYEDDKNIFSIMIIDYATDKEKVAVSDVQFCPIEFLDWDCLTIGALGWGQIQIANSNAVTINHGASRKEWMLALCERVLDFYPREILKIRERVRRFEDVRKYWEEKREVWS